MQRVVIMGAAGRDFHDVNTIYRGDPSTEVVAFTRAPGQNVGDTEDQRMDRYPTALAGERYSHGIPIIPESELERPVEEQSVDRVVFSYSDVSRRSTRSTASTPNRPAAPVWARISGSKHSTSSNGSTRKASTAS